MYYICPKCGATVNSQENVCNECGCPINSIKAQGHKKEESFSATSSPRELEAAANSGDVDAMYWLSYCLYYGENGFEEDELAAEKWLTKAAEKGNSQAIADLHEWFGVHPSGDYPSSITTSGQKLGTLFSKFNRLVFFDLETSGLNPLSDQIIEIGALVVESQNSDVHIVSQMDDLIRLPDGKRLDTKIIELTGISNETLKSRGKDARIVCQNFSSILSSDKTLMIAYNAQFDMSFLKTFFEHYGEGTSFNRLHALDAMTIYKDRRSYPHKLIDAINAYSLDGTVRNSHNALDDAKSLLAVLLAMDSEKNDLDKYIDLFGFNPKWGISGQKLPGIRYVAQPYNSFRRLYE